MVLPEYKADVILNDQLQDLSISPCLLYHTFDIYYFNLKFYYPVFKLMYLSYRNIFPGDSVDTVLSGMLILEYMLTHPDFAVSPYSFSIYSQIRYQYDLFIAMNKVEGYEYLEHEYVSRSSTPCALYREIFSLFFYFFDNLESCLASLYKSSIFYYCIVINTS
jgi:hypothetical protein